MVNRTRLTNPVECDTAASQDADLVRLDQLTTRVAPFYSSAENWTNVSTGLTVLASTIIPANTFSSTSTDWSYISVRGFGYFASNANQKHVELFLNSTQLISTQSQGSYQDAYWNIEADFFVVNDLVFSARVMISDGTYYTLQNEGTVLFDTTVANTISFKGQGGATDDVEQKAMLVFVNKAL